MWPDRTLEFAMTQRMGASGTAERYMRPPAIRDVADRVRRWSVQAEACRSCVSLPALVVRSGEALCGRCLTNRSLRAGHPDPEGLAPRTIRAGEESTADLELQGYAIVFNAKSVDMGFVEIIRPVAADRLETEKPDLRGLWNHNSDQTIARVSAGTMRVEKRTRGVYATYVPPAWASSHLESVARRDITGQSFGFIAIDDQWHLEDSEPVREIFDMEVIETSAVAFPAYPQTTLRTVSAGERHQDKSARLGRRLRLVG